MNQLVERLEASIKQSFRVAVTQGEVADSFDPAARANLIVAFVIGRWQRFAKSGFKRVPTDGIESQLPALLV